MLGQLLKNQRIKRPQYDITNTQKYVNNEQNYYNFVLNLNGKLLADLDFAYGKNHLKTKKSNFVKNISST